MGISQLSEASVNQWHTISNVKLNKAKAKFQPSSLDFMFMGILKCILCLQFLAKLHIKKYICGNHSLNHTFLSKFLKTENANGACCLLWTFTDTVCRGNLSKLSNSCWKLASYCYGLFTINLVNTDSKYKHKMQAINSSLLLRQIVSMYKLVTDKSFPCPITVNKHSWLVNTQPYLNLVFSLFMGLFLLPFKSMENSHSSQWNRTRQLCALNMLQFIQILSLYAEL